MIEILLSIQNCGDKLIIGQEKLCQKINALTLDTFPRTLLLLGEYGSGKHTLVNYIGDRFKCEIEDISKNLSLEYIEVINQRVTPMIYLIDAKELTVKNENVILKFLEEPLKNSFIVVLSENKYSIIPTILNRCQIWELETYEDNYLMSFITNPSIDVDTLLKVANTPGKVIEYQSYPIKDMIALAQKIFVNIGRANISNTLTPRLILLKRDYANINSFTSINGRLYNNYHTINNDLGYFKIGQNQHLSSSSDMTLQEEQDIINQLENGVYY